MKLFVLWTKDSRRLEELGKALTSMNSPPDEDAHIVLNGHEVDVQVLKLDERVDELIAAASDVKNTRELEAVVGKLVVQWLKNERKVG